MSTSELGELKSQLDELLENKFVRPSLSSCGAPVLLGKKKFCSVKLCVDYRQLNKDNFQELKKRLTTTPVLILLDTNESFVVYYDDSKMGLGGVLMHNRQVVTYTSRELGVHERNYPTYDLELATMIFVLNVWRHYLFGSRFEVFGDHKSLEYLFDQKELNMRQRRWLEFFKDYDFELSYHPGKANVVVDTLSRKSLHMSTLMINFPLEKLTEIYISVVAKLHGIPSSIVPNRYPRFMSRFWESLHAALGTKLRLSSAYHPQTNGQTERTI
ncbi:hypothetical protein KIW84_010356 [Lathyrus oleraceus]|uniref:Integrase catalytic domain-containing protein n=1 Tax=Pisum sativum TaxID=3888 RepID=A0A9D4YJV2_PEA|nr:hypothetical protein KIW84_010356 [Pisum sativum]